MEDIPPVRICSLSHTKGEYRRGLIVQVVLGRRAPSATTRKLPGTLGHVGHTGKNGIS